MGVQAQEAHEAQEAHDYSVIPLLAIVILQEGLPEELPNFSTALTTSEPAIT